jgi:hypothetical protein
VEDRHIQRPLRRRRAEFLGREPALAPDIGQHFLRPLSGKSSHGGADDGPKGKNAFMNRHHIDDVAGFAPVGGGGRSISGEVGVAGKARPFPVDGDAAGDIAVGAASRCEHTQHVRLQFSEGHGTVFQSVPPSDALPYRRAFLRLLRSPMRRRGWVVDGPHVPKRPAAVALEGATVKTSEVFRPGRHAAHAAFCPHFSQEIIVSELTLLSKGNSSESAARAAWEAAAGRGPAPQRLMDSSTSRD